jgi:hypothetical protein
MAVETTAESAGPFWDVIAGRADPLPAAKTLGWKLVAIDPDSGTIEVAFEASAVFTTRSASSRAASSPRCSTTR